MLPAPKNQEKEQDTMDENNVILKDKKIKGSTGGTMQERMERASWMLCGIEMLAEATASNSVMKPYNEEIAAEIIKVLAWEAGAELSACYDAIV